MIKWYAIPHENKVGSYKVSGGLTDFPRGVLLAYRDCCLVTGLASEKDAEKAIKKYPCQKVKEAPHD